MSKTGNPTNKFDEHFENVSLGHERDEINRSKFIEGVVALSEIKKGSQQKQRELLDKESAYLKLSERNQELKEILMKSLINKEEKLARRSNLKAAIERMSLTIEDADRETDMYVNNDMVDSLCDRYSTANLVSLVSKIQDAKCKLINKYNEPPCV